MTDHRKAALALLNGIPMLPHKTAGFLGHVCVAPDLSEKQSAWLAKLVGQYSDQLRIGGVA
jgi:hypothetical protein